VRTARTTSWTRSKPAMSSWQKLVPARGRGHPREACLVAAKLWTGARARGDAPRSDPFSPPLFDRLAECPPPRCASVGRRALPCSRTLTLPASMSRPPMTSNGVDFGLFGVPDCVDLVGRVIGLAAHKIRAQFRSRCPLHSSRAVLFIRRREDPTCSGRQPEREVAGVMLDEKTDEPLVRPQRRAMMHKRRLVRVSLSR